MDFKNQKFFFHFLIAFLIRFIFTIYGIYFDAIETKNGNHLIMFNVSISSQNIPKYTDIDYNVFSDAAAYVFKGKSPYLRETYRYTPLLAIILQPNIYLNESFGKFLFILFDLLCGYMIIKINKLDKSSENNIYSTLVFWFFNPITIAISSRGNAESIMSFLVLTFIYFLLKRSFLTAGFLYALAIHFKIYPITYAVAILLNIIFNRKDISLEKLFKLDTIKRLFKFGFMFLVTFASLTLYFYNKYGYQFLYETYLYHLVRKDIRHNFSPYFYMLYLNSNNEIFNSESILFKLISFMPQMILILGLSVLLYKHLKLCLFLITFSFVALNKVCTSQYFIWYLSLIPILIPKLTISWKKAVALFSLWMFGQGLWLYFAYKLEFLGENTFLQLWIASLVFLFINSFVIINGFVNCYQYLNDNNSIKKVD